MIDKSSVVGALAAAAGEKKTLVEEGTHFKGSLSSNCPVVVRGKIEGDVQAPSLNVSSSGALHGKVKVTELRSAGELAGDFEADVIQLSGVVKDNTVIRAKSLEVKLTAPQGKMQVIFGDCSLDVGDAPTKEEAVEEDKKRSASLRPPKDEKTTSASKPAPPMPEAKADKAAEKVVEKAAEKVVEKAAAEKDKSEKTESVAPPPAGDDHKSNSDRAAKSP